MATNERAFTVQEARDEGSDSAVALLRAFGYAAGAYTVALIVIFSVWPQPDLVWHAACLVVAFAVGVVSAVRGLDTVTRTPPPPVRQGGRDLVVSDEGLEVSVTLMTASSSEARQARQEGGSLVRRWQDIDKVLIGFACTSTTGTWQVATGEGGHRTDKPALILVMKRDRGWKQGLMDAALNAAGQSTAWIAISRLDVGWPALAELLRAHVPVEVGADVTERW